MTGEWLPWHADREWLRALGVFAALGWIAASAWQVWSWVAVLPQAVSCVALSGFGYLLSNVGVTFLSAALAIVLLWTIGTRPGNPGRIGRAVAGTGLFFTALGGAFIAYIVVILFEDTQTGWGGQVQHVLVVSNLIVPSLAGLAGIVVASMSSRGISGPRTSLRSAVCIASGVPVALLISGLAVIAVDCGSPVWFLPR